MVSTSNRCAGKDIYAGAMTEGVGSARRAELRKQRENMKRTLIERIEVSTAGDRAKVFADLIAEGYSIVSSGPYTDAKMFPRVDVSRTMITAERPATRVLENAAALEASLLGFAELSGDPDARMAISEWRATEVLYKA